MKTVYLSIFFSLPAFTANPVQSIPAIGPHYPLFRFEKNENPQNVMVIYSKADSECRLETQNDKPLFETYWLMDGKKYKRVHRLIKIGIRDRLEVVPSKDKSSFFVKLNDLDEVESDIRDVRLQVRSQKSDHGCHLLATMTLGPSDQNRTILLEKLYSDSSKTILPPFRKIKSITLTGVDVNTGEKVKRTYQAR